MIETTVAALLSIKPIFQELSTRSMPAKDSFRVMRSLMALEKEYAAIDETRLKCLERYGVLDENGKIMVDEKGQVILQPEKIDVFNKEFNSFLNTKVKVSCEKIKLDWLESFNFTPTELMNLESFIEE